MFKRLSAAIAAFLFVMVLLGDFLNVPVLAGSSAYASPDDLYFKYKARKAKRFLVKYGSPLAPSAEKFIEVSEKNGIDWKFLISITGIESTFGKYIPYQSYNPYGFANGQAVFENFDESIETVGRYLSGMKKKGLDTPEKLGPIYTPPNYKNWTYAVNYFMDEIENGNF